MKKIFAVILSLVMVLAMGTVVFAAGSPTAGVSVNTAKDKNGKDISLTKSEVSEKIVDEAKGQAANLEGDATVVSTFDLTPPAGTSGPYTITLSVAGITASDKVVILHKATTGWETVNATAGNGTVTFTVNTLSPISVVKVGTKSSSGSGTAGSTTTDNSVTDNSVTDNSVVNNSTVTYNNSNNYTVTGSAGNGSTGNNSTAASSGTSVAGKASTSTISPKTGETAPTVLVVALVAMSGLVFFARKARA
ncbi:MAG: hypothetical protein U0K86_08460 [Agathobacter sp.]|nr:hypothetical protein [Agathobacter sp.]